MIKFRVVWLCIFGLYYRSNEKYEENVERSKECGRNYGYNF